MIEQAKTHLRKAQQAVRQYEQRRATKWRALATITDNLRCALIKLNHTQEEIMSTHLPEDEPDSIEWHEGEAEVDDPDATPSPKDIPDESQS